MAQYHCSKCGETASSKCASSRSVFPEDQGATMLSNFTDFEINRDSKFPVGLIRMHYMDETQTDVEIIEQMIRNLNFALERGQIAHAVCQHRWILDSDKCELDCCTKKEN